MSSRSSQYVEVQLEIGHRATPKTVVAEEDGHTHDWTVFVRGPEKSSIEHFVEKVIFYLHESFPKPKRVVKEPPYQVSESGYAGFELPVEVYFKNKEEPKKIAFDYDLYLRLDDSVSHSRREKLTFQNPSNDFKKKLLKAGGVTNETSGPSVKTSSHSDDKHLQQQTSSKDTTNTNNNTNTTTTTTTNNSNNNSKHKGSLATSDGKKSKTLGVIPSKDKSLIKSQNATTITQPTNPPPVADKQIKPPNKQFTDLFGSPIQARPDSIAKSKDNLSKTKSTEIASKSLKNSESSKSSHKKSEKISSQSLSPNHKSIDIIKSSKELTTKDKKDKKEPKDSKTTTKESIKSKRDDDSISISSSKSKKNRLLSPKAYEPSDKKSDKKSSESKSTKKRRNSTSSNSSSLTASSYGGGGTGIESKSHTKDPQKSSNSNNKDKDIKKDSKRQKVLSKDSNTSSGRKKESSTSTKISFSDNNTNTTIEIKSIKKEKTWDKSRSKEFKSAKDKPTVISSNNNNISTNNTSAGSLLNSSKSKIKSEPNSIKSSKVNGNKYTKASKDKYGSYNNNINNRERSSSPSSSSLKSPINERDNQRTAAFESNDSMSPPSSDNTSPIGIIPIRPNRKPESNHNNRLLSLNSLDSSDDDAITKSLNTSTTTSKSSKPYTNSKNESKEFDKTTNSNKRLETTTQQQQQQHNSQLQSSLKRKKSEFQSKEQQQPNKRLLDNNLSSIAKSDRLLTTVALSSPDYDDSVRLNDLMDVQKRINESTNSDLLQKIVDIIEESGSFSLTDSTFDFDLMRLDDKTVRKLKSYLG
ncbi:protein AF-9-like isoform X1 [Oppia nitens]|uniref:protein AF-9-like isoform X1 n=1 Tax=Oppia nitens TaxID=1686743 RepID=UPI0023DAA4BC|nr:protein AF-9-like isoform X1 [Oppia nitens]